MAGSRSLRLRAETPLVMRMALPVETALGETPAAWGTEAAAIRGKVPTAAAEAAAVAASFCARMTCA
jgi:hypothetical protein